MCSNVLQGLVPEKEFLAICACVKFPAYEQRLAIGRLKTFPVFVHVCRCADKLCQDPKPEQVPMGAQ